MKKLLFLIATIIFQSKSNSDIKDNIKIKAYVCQVANSLIVSKYESDQEFNDIWLKSNNFGSNSIGLFMLRFDERQLKFSEVDVVRINHDGKIFIGLDAYQNNTLVRITVRLLPNGLLDQTLNPNSERPGILITAKN